MVEVCYVLIIRDVEFGCFKLQFLYDESMVCEVWRNGFVRVFFSGISDIGVVEQIYVQMVVMSVKFFMYVSCGEFLCKEVVGLSVFG